MGRFILPSPRAMLSHMAAPLADRHCEVCTPDTPTLPRPEVDAMRMDLLRVQYDEQRRSEMRKKSFQPTEGKPQGGLKPWREVVTPHPDVASGKYQQAEKVAARAEKPIAGELHDDLRIEAAVPFGRDAAAVLEMAEDCLRLPSQRGIAPDDVGRFPLHVQVGAE